MGTGLPLWREWGEAELSPLAAKVQARLASGLPVHDFITTNPYDHGFRFDEVLLGEFLQKAGNGASRYAADPLGRVTARGAVAAFHGNGVAPAQVVLTPGTSMAYFYLFRLLARPGGEVLCPAPTYPLFEDLAKIAGLNVRRYHLEKSVDVQGTIRWIVDPRELEFQITARTCAIVLVSPHNPTGTIISHNEMSSLCRVADQAGVPLILDEVFRSYIRQRHTPVTRPSELGSGLSFTLNGLSKSHYLPGLKAGWIVVEGDAPATGAILNALEYMSDSFLPVSEITQAAIPDLLGPDGLAEVARLSALQRTALETRLLQTRNYKATVPEAGPYLCMELSPERFQDENAVVYHLLEEKGALVHPGHLYRFPDPCLVATIYNPELLHKLTAFR
jgi:aspartate/methionine/tyrosine aminotransferase